MNTNPQISILVPVYKVEAYLQRCIDSVLSQNLQDWEMILVDDGSPDRSPEICDKAALMDKRIQVVHKKNGGTPSARLAGYANARGKYLVFLDSDDWLLDGALITLYHEITSGDYDIVKSRPLRIDKYGNKSLESYSLNNAELCDEKSYGKSIIMNNIHPYLHSGIYKKDIFTKNIFEIASTYKMHYCEDWFTNMLLTDKVHHVKIIDIPTHAYYINEVSVTGTVVYSCKINHIIDDVVRDYFNSISNELGYWIECKKCIFNIRLPFFPENKFTFSIYQQAKYFWKEHKNDIESNIDKKFVRFINFPLLYIIYVYCYKFLYKWIKQKGHLHKTYP